MKIRLHDLRRLIREAVGSEDLAACVGTGGVLALYRPAELTSIMMSGDVDNLGSAIVGYLQVKPAPACDAWELSELWGPRYGEMLVDLAFVLSSDGRLVIDRQVVSDKASAMWRRIAEKVKVEPLPAGCETYHEDPSLNVIYVSGGDPGRLSALQTRHNEVMDELSGELNMPPKKLERSIIEAGWERFNASLPSR